MLIVLPLENFGKLCFCMCLGCLWSLNGSNVMWFRRCPFCHHGAQRSSTVSSKDKTMIKRSNKFLGQSGKDERDILQKMY